MVPAVRLPDGTEGPAAPAGGPSPPLLDQVSIGQLVRIAERREIAPPGDAIPRAGRSRQEPLRPRRAAKSVVAAYFACCAVSLAGIAGGAWAVAKGDVEADARGLALIGLFVLALLAVASQAAALFRILPGAGRVAFFWRGRDKGPTSPPGPGPAEPRSYLLLGQVSAFELARMAPVGWGATAHGRPRKLRRRPSFAPFLWAAVAAAALFFLGAGIAGSVVAIARGLTGGGMTLGVAVLGLATLLLSLFTVYAFGRSIVAALRDPRRRRSKRLMRQVLRELLQLIAAGRRVFGTAGVSVTIPVRMALLAASSLALAGIGLGAALGDPGQGPAPAASADLNGTPTAGAGGAADGGDARLGSGPAAPPSANATNTAGASPPVETATGASATATPAGASGVSPPSQPDQTAPAGATAGPTGRPPSQSPGATAKPSPTGTTRPAATATVQATASPGLSPAATSTPTRTATPTPDEPAATATFTPTPTTAPATPTETPAPTCAKDADCDGVLDDVETFYKSNPNDPGSTPEDNAYAKTTCSDGKDNDGDGLIDAKDAGCL